MIFVATKKGTGSTSFPPLLLLLFLDPGSEGRDEHFGSATLFPGFRLKMLEKKQHEYVGYRTVHPTGTGYLNCKGFVCILKASGLFF